MCNAYITLKFDVFQSEDLQLLMLQTSLPVWSVAMTCSAKSIFCSKFSFLQRTFTIQLLTDGRATCRIGIKPDCRFMAEALYKSMEDLEVTYAFHL